MRNNSIDIIIPSFRVEETTIRPILSLGHPPDFEVNYYLVVDNPSKKIPESILQLSKAENINLVVNKNNIGVSATRNKGMSLGNGQWILFLDDDIAPQPDLLFRYGQAINEHGTALGFVGVTFFPPPFNAATNAMLNAGYTEHFTLSTKTKTQKWAPTSNILINRQKTGAELFDESLTKSGEDIDFLLRLSMSNDSEFISLPTAVAQHPWWNMGSIQSVRLFRYGQGNAMLLTKNPTRSYTYIDFGNSLETALILIVLFPFLYSILPVPKVILLLVSPFCCDLLISPFKVKTNTWKYPATPLYLSWAKWCFEAGVLFEIIESKRLSYIFRRLDLSFRKENPSNFRLNRWKIAKLVLMSILLVLIFFIY